LISLLLYSQVNTMKRLLWLITLIAGLSVGHHPTFAQASALPPSIRSCVSPPAVLAKVVATTQTPTSTYYRVILQDAARNGDYILIRQQGGSCTALSKFNDPPRPMESYVPKSVAQALAMDQEQRMIREYGKEQYQAGLLESAQNRERGVLVFVDPAIVWADKQLGIDRPPGEVILTPDFNPSYGRGR
jgi:hypothetical protein